MSTSLSTASAPKALSTIDIDSFSLSNVTQVKMPRPPATTWNWSTFTRNWSEKSLTGIIIGLGGVQHDLWPRADEGKDGTVPYIRSIDGVIGHVIGDDSGDLDLDLIKAATLPDGTINCKDLIYFQWQEKNGKNIAPQAKASRVVVILLEEGNKPVFVRLSSTSIPVLAKWLALAKEDHVEPYQMVASVEVEVVRGDKAQYARIVPKLVRVLDDEHRDQFKGVYEAISPKLLGSITKYEKKGSAEAVPF